MDEYGQALLIDAVTVLSCVALLFRYGDLRLSHPGTPYIVFHVHTVTARLAGLFNGAAALYTNSPGEFEPVMPDEILRAAMYADIAFWTVTLVWLFVKTSPRDEPTDRAMMLEPRLFRPILLITFILGLIGLRVAAKLPGVDLYEIDASSPWSTSSYLIILPSWYGLAVIGHIYYYGFKRWTVFLLSIYLFLMAIQGGMRFRFIIGLLLAVQIWVEHRNQRWPSRTLLLGLVAAGLLFFPMKDLGQILQSGGSAADVSAAVSDSATDVSEGSASDQLFLDEFASGLTLLDLQGKKYWGSVYLPLLTLPIPRALWPDKPVLAGFLADISSRTRPMSTSGMIVTYLGESYANFGVAGVFLVPPLLAWLLALFYRSAYRAPRNSVLRFSYVLLAVNLIQVYRDGLVSIVVFTFVNMMPLMFIVLAHMFAAAVRKRRHLGLATFDQ
jgi:hypothetical protein